MVAALPVSKRRPSALKARSVTASLHVAFFRRCPSSTTRYSHLRPAACWFFLSCCLATGCLRAMRQTESLYSRRSGTTRMCTEKDGVMLGRRAHVAGVVIAHCGVEQHHRAGGLLWRAS